MRVAIIGSGYVGLCTGACLAEIGHQVACVDIDAAKIETLQSGRMPIFEPDLDVCVARNVSVGRLSFTTDFEGAVRGAEVVFVCVGTPPDAEGRADLSAIEQSARRIASAFTPGRYVVVVEKSTVPVITGEKMRMVIARYAPPGSEFDVASNPEFLAEGSAMRDAMNPSRIVVGAPSQRAERVLRELYAPIQAPLIVTDVKSAELIKHASNSFLATKISFINAVSTICDLVGADVALVARGMGLDDRIGPRFLSAGVGYGGSCFPKDVDAFYHIARELGYDFALLREVQAINKAQQSRFLKMIRDELWMVRDKRVAVLGIAFKPNTDDIRNAPAIPIIHDLAAGGARVVAWDPKAVERARPELPASVQLTTDLYEALAGAECAAVLTDWREVTQMNLARAKSLMAHPIVIDGRNVFDPKVMADLGFTYRCVGRPTAGRKA